jgi:hypothetical protein
MRCKLPECTGVHDTSKPSSTWCPSVRAKQRAWWRTPKGKAYQAKYQARYRASPKGKIYKTRNNIKHTYGIDLENFQAQMEHQDGVCPITGRAPTEHRRFDIDHCHATGKLRGLIYWKINRGLAWFNDNPEWLRRAAEYLESGGVWHEERFVPDKKKKKRRRKNHEVGG